METIELRVMELNNNATIAAVFDGLNKCFFGLPVKSSAADIVKELRDFADRIEDLDSRRVRYVTMQRKDLSHNDQKSS